MGNDFRLGENTAYSHGFQHATAAAGK